MEVNYVFQSTYVCRYVSWCKEQGGYAYNFCRMKWSQGLTKEGHKVIFILDQKRV